MIKRKWYCHKDKKRNEWCAESFTTFLFIPLTLKRLKGPFNSIDSACRTCTELNKFIKK